MDEHQHSRRDCQAAVSARRCRPSARVGGRTSRDLANSVSLPARKQQLGISAAGRSTQEAAVSASECLVLFPSESARLGPGDSRSAGRMRASGVVVPGFPNQPDPTPSRWPTEIAGAAGSQTSSATSGLLVVVDLDRVPELDAIEGARVRGRERVRVAGAVVGGRRGRRVRDASPLAVLAAREGARAPPRGARPMIDPTR